MLYNAWMRFFVLKPTTTIYTDRHYMLCCAVGRRCLLCPKSNVVISFYFHNWIFYCDTNLSLIRAHCNQSSYYTQDNFKLKLLSEKKITTSNGTDCPQHPDICWPG